VQQFLDNVTLNGVKETQEGYLVADAFAVRTGIQKYAGFEVGRPELPVVNVYRPETEVFSADTLRSFSHVPVTNDHPNVAVTAENWKDFAVGEASTEVLRDGEKMRIPLVLKDKSVIADVKNGKRELSAGYSCELVGEDGIAPDGTPYQAKQVNIRANHIAVVKHGRAGSEFRIGDGASNWGVAPLTEDANAMNLRPFVVDGITIQVTDQGADALTKYQQRLADTAAQLESLKTQHAAEIATKDAKIGELTVELQQAKDAAPTAQMLDAMAAERSAVIDAAKRLKADIVTDSKSLADIRKEAVAAKFGDELVKDASEDTIKGMFLAATKDAAAPDPVRDTLMHRDARPGPQQVQDSQTEYETRLRDAWIYGPNGAPAKAQ